MFNKVARSGFRQLMEADGFNTFRSLGLPLFTKYADADVNIDIVLSIPAGKSATLIWGDGNESSVVGPQIATTYNNIYANAGLNYNVSISGDTEFIGLFHCTSQPISGTYASIAAALPAAADLRLNTTQMGNDIAPLSALTALTLILIHSTAGTGDLRSWAPLINLVTLRCNSNTIDYTQGVLPNWDPCAITIWSLGFSEQETDDFLIDLDTSSVASVQALIMHGSNAAPSAAGDVAKASLITKGRAVTTS